MSYGQARRPAPTSSLLHFYPSILLCLHPQAALDTFVAKNQGWGFCLHLMSYKNLNIGFTELSFFISGYYFTILYLEAAPIINTF